MSWLLSRALCDVLTSLPGQEEDFLQAISLDGEPCVLWNGTPSQPPSWCSDKTMACCQLSRSGMTFKLSQEPYLIPFRGLMLWLEDSRAKTSARPEKEQGLTGSGAVCGTTWQELLVKFDHDSFSWRTHHCLWDEVLPESSVTLPRWGMMRSGECWERTMPEHLISGTASGLSVPTPTAGDSRSSGSRNTKESKAHPGVSLTDYVKEDGGKGRMFPTPAANPYGSNQGGALGRKGKIRPSLETMARKSLWPTPSARDYKGASAPEKRKAAGRQVGLNDQVKAWPTPSARDWKDSPGMSKEGVNPDGSVRKRDDQLARRVFSEETSQAGGQLNPTWVEAYLLGWPVAWTSMEPLPKEVFQEWERTFLTGLIGSSALATDRSPSAQP